MEAPMQTSPSNPSNPGPEAEADATARAGQPVFTAAQLRAIRRVLRLGIEEYREAQAQAQATVAAEADEGKVA